MQRSKTIKENKGSQPQKPHFETEQHYSTLFGDNTERHEGTAEDGFSEKLSGPQTYLQLLVAREEKEYVC